MLPLPPPEPLPLLQAAAADSVTAGLASLPQDLREQSSRHVVMLRGRRRLFCSRTATSATPSRWPSACPAGKPPPGRIAVLQKIPNPLWVHAVRGARVEA